MKFLQKTFKVALVLALAFVLSGASTAIAAGVTLVSDTMTRQKVSTASNHVIKFTTPTGVAAGSTIKLTFPTENYATTAGTFDLSTLTAGDIAVSGLTPASITFATVAPAVATNQIIITNNASAVAGGTAITVTLGGNKVINPAVAGSWKVGISGSFGDIGAFAIPTYADDTVVITAEVDPYINFAITNTTDNAVDFGVLTGGVNKYATDAAGGDVTPGTVAHQMVADTNATSGYVISVISSDITKPTLTAANGTDTIDAIGGATAVVPSTTVEQFGMRVAVATAGSGTSTLAAKYNNGVAGAFGGGDETTPSVVASVASYTTPYTYDVSYVANSIASTPAGNYSTAKIFTAVGNF